NNPHISYYGDGWLKHAIKKDSIWYTERIDSAWGASIEATYTGIAVDRNGHAHISYNTQIRVDSDLIINTRYATGLPEAGIEIEMDRRYGNLLMVCPSISISQREVKIEYVLEKQDNVNVSIYNIMGQKVTELVNERKQPGRYKDYWKTESVGSGIYFCCLVIDGKLIVVRKMEILN
ncbi:T9SS type A sorting domain-containing protein, partial [candidate division WOR-3 bacterium]|nr:T9SS type A sorting domain-containing protein [candidate division WOR-3 bacterium]